MSSNLLSPRLKKNHLNLTPIVFFVDSNLGPGGLVGNFVLTDVETWLEERGILKMPNNRLEKPVPTNCLFCGKYIPDSRQSSRTIYCSQSCIHKHWVMKRKSSSFSTSFTLPHQTRQLLPRWDPKSSK